MWTGVVGLRIQWQSVTSTALNISISRKARNFFVTAEGMLTSQYRRYYLVLIQTDTCSHQNSVAVFLNTFITFVFLPPL
jgi:hypothetical protein